MRDILTQKNLIARNAPSDHLAFGFLSGVPAGRCFVAGLFPAIEVAG